MRRFLIGLFSFFVQFSFGQTVDSDAVSSKESFLQLNDKVLKTEIGLFSVKASALKKTDSLSVNDLIPVPIHSCTEKEIHLNITNFFGPLDTYIDLFFKDQASGKELDSIKLITHSHFWVKVPKSAYQGLYRTYTCDFKNNSKKSTFFSPYYKAFYSKDKRRLYIYMQGETKYGKCEATWVIMNDRYYTRVLDNIP